MGRCDVLYENTLPDFDYLAKIPDYVMPDLIRYPEYAEITGFRPSPEWRFKGILGFFTKSSSFFFDQTGRSQPAAAFVWSYISKVGVGSILGHFGFVGWVEPTPGFVGFRCPQPNLHFADVIAKCETQQRPFFGPAGALIGNRVYDIRCLCWRRHPDLDLDHSWSTRSLVETLLGTPS